MTLVVDIGNSRLKWAHVQRGSLTDVASVGYTTGDVSDVLEAQWGRLGPPRRVLVASVRGKTVSRVLRNWVSNHWNRDTEFVTASAFACGVQNAYVEPVRLGADRWAAMIAVRQRQEGPSCIVDCGTAVTVDVLDEAGVHLGGLILPGLTMMRRALARETDGIGAVVSGRMSLLARNTDDAVTAGTLYALVAAIHRIVAEVTAESGRELNCVITGGDADTVLPFLGGNWVHEPDLVLCGLAVIAQR